MTIGLLHNPQMDLQAQDWAHRIGQTKPVLIFFFFFLDLITVRLGVQNPM